MWRISRHKFTYEHFQKCTVSSRCFFIDRFSHSSRLATAEAADFENFWRHVRTDDNPADLGSRGCTLKELRVNKLWWYGPNWLQLQQNPPRSFQPTNLKVKVSALFTTSSETIDLVLRFCSFDRYIRVTSYVFRFYQKVHKIINSIYWLNRSRGSRSNEKPINSNRTRIFLQSRNILSSSRAKTLQEKLTSDSESISGRKWYWN